MDLLRRFCCIAALTLSGALSLAPAHAQVVPSAYGPADSLWVGAEYSNINASFPYQSGQRIEGAGVFADFHLRSRISIEGDARFLTVGGFEGSTESSYLAGPRVFLFARGNFRPYGKMLVGVGKIRYPFAVGDANYLALAPGGGTEYRVSHYWALRVEYEYQIWPDSPGYANEPDHPLTPNGFHVGIAYSVFRHRSIP
jgi:opacity protein-like surface antigen